MGGAERSEPSIQRWRPVDDSEDLAAAVAGLKRTVSRQEATIAKLQSTVTSLNETLAERDARVAELEDLLEESRRSGKRQAAPFRHGDPTENPKRPGRKTGAAHGRHGHRLPPPEPDRSLEAALPDACPHCGGQIDHVRDAEQFQTDLPALPPPATTRFNVAIGRCRTCGRRVQGRHPEQTSDALGAAGAQVGPNAKSWAAWLHYSLGVPFAKISRLFAERLGLSVTAGAICQSAQSTSTDLVPVSADIRAGINAAPVVVMDETGWRVNAEPWWTWVATTPGLTYYDVAAGRGFAQATGLLDADYSGTIVHDGWSAYGGYEGATGGYQAATHQTCVRHFTRRCEELIESLPDWARGTPREVRGLLGEALDARDEGKKQRREVIADLTERVELLHEQAHPHDECRKLVNHLYNNRRALFTFLADPDVDATSWRAEQAIRPTTVTRKVCGGNRSDRGAETQGRMMTLFRTASQQGVDAVEFLVHLARAPDPATVAFFT
ncbi:MAG: IS66 family transposase [Acidimicrobiales bacterium]